MSGVCRWRRSSAVVSLSPPAHRPRSIVLALFIPPNLTRSAKRWMRNRVMIGHKTGRTGCPPLQRSWLVAPDLQSIFSCSSQSRICFPPTSAVLTEYIPVYSFSVKEPRTFWTSGSTFNSTKTSVAHILRTFANLGAQSRKTGQNTGTSLVVVALFTAPLSALARKWLRSVARRAPANSLPNKTDRTSPLSMKRF